MKVRTFLIGSLSAIALSTAALAGPQYVDETGYALSGYDTVAYWSLEQNPVGEPQTPAVRGDARFTAEWNGATWAFASAENRDLFIADPERYAPEYDGHCAYGVAQGGKVPANPNLWRIVDDKLYVNITPTVVGFWEENISGLIGDAETKWSGLESNPASDRSWTSINDNDGTYTAVGPITE
ncbi:MAG: YHS domain-containing (seleno)protein [Paracoccaceae bacterium]